VKRLLGVALGVLTAIGGFVDIGDLVTNAVVGSRFGLSLVWVVGVGVVGICLFANMSGRVAAASGRATFEVIRERLGPRAGLANLSASFPHQPDDGNGGNRRCGPGTPAGQQRPLPAVDPGGRARGLAGGVAGQVFDHGERHGAAGADADRVRRGAVPAQTGLGKPGRAGPGPRCAGRGIRVHLLVLRHRPVRRGHDSVRGVLLLLRSGGRRLVHQGPGPVPDQRPGGLPAWAACCPWRSPAAPRWCFCPPGSP
jgi:hypothetical protein